MTLPEFVEAAVLRPGDVLVVRLGTVANHQQVAEFEEQIRARLPNQRVLVLGGAIKQLVVAAAETE